MNIDVNAILVQNAPGALPWLAGLIIAYFVVKFLVLTFDSIASLSGPVGRYFRDRQAITSSESRELRKKWVDLNKVVKSLQYRDACYFAYVLKDQDWHQQFDLLAVRHGWEPLPPKHESYLDFRKKWIDDRGLEKEFEPWT